MSINKQIILIAIIGLLPVIAFSQNLEQINDMSFGGNTDDGIHSILTLDDGSFFIYGSTQSNPQTGNKTAPKYGTGTNSDLWLIKLDAAANKLWDKSYGGSEWEVATTSLVRSGEHLYLISVSTSDISGNRTAPQKSSNNNSDIWVIKVDLEGNIIWDKSYGGNEAETIDNAVATGDGGILMVGGTRSSNSGDITTDNVHGNEDPWVFKIDTTGTILWQKRFPTINTARFSAVAMDDDGNFVVASSTNTPNDSLKNVDQYGDWDIWALKLNSSGDIISQKAFGGQSSEDFPTLLFHSGRYYLACGTVGEASGNKTVGNVGVIDTWILQLDKDLAIVRQAIVGGEGVDAPDYRTTLSAENGFITIPVATNSPSGTGNWGSTTHHGDFDFLLVRLDTTLEIKTGVQTGGIGSDRANSVGIDQDGKTVLAGSSSSPPSGSKNAQLYGTSAGWLVWLDTPVFTEEYHQPENSVVLYPNPAVHALHFESGSDYKNYTLFSITGEQLQSGRVTEGQNRIEVADLPSGMYIIRLEGEGVSFTKKWVKG